MTVPVFEGFSLSHAAILDKDTGLPEDWGDIYGVRNGTIATDSGNYDNTGDDAVLSTWFWFNFATLTIESGYVPFKTIASLSGSSVTSSGAAPNDYFTLPLWNQFALNQPSRPVLVRVPSKDSEGETRTLDFILYKVFFQPFNFTGPSYKAGLLLSYTGRAVLSNKDHKGNTLSERRIGELVASPGNL